MFDNPLPSNFNVAMFSAEVPRVDETNQTLRAPSQNLHVSTLIFGVRGAHYVVMPRVRIVCPSTVSTVCFYTCSQYKQTPSIVFLAKTRLYSTGREEPSVSSSVQL